MMMSLDSIIVGCVKMAGVAVGRSGFTAAGRVRKRAGSLLAPVLALTFMAAPAIGQPAIGQAAIEQAGGPPADPAPPVDGAAPDTFGFTAPSASEDEAAALAAGEPVVDVRKDDSDYDAAGAVTAGIEINAPREIVWALMTNCARSPTYVKSLERCTVLDADPDGAWDVREHIVDWSSLMPKTRSVFRSDYREPALIAFQRVAGDLEFLQGVWRLEAIGENRTRVWYQSRVSVGAPVPRFMIRGAVKGDTADVLAALKEQAEADAQGG